MSNITPSIHVSPAGPCTSCPRSSTQQIVPSARTIRYSIANGRPSLAAARASSITLGRSSGWIMSLIVRVRSTTNASRG
jgi:hypothetical protein